MTPSYSRFAGSVRPETAFTVLAVAKTLAANGKDVIELEIGDSPFATPPEAVEAAVDAMRAGRTRYGPSAGLPEFREAASAYVNREYGLASHPGNVVAGPGAKSFEQLFCEVFVDPGDGVLVFSPHFPTYGPNVERRGGRLVLSRLRADRGFRPNLDDVERFLAEDPRPKAVFVNSPHNPTGGVAEPDDLQGLAALVRGRDVAVFSDEPYDRMAWSGRHHSVLAEPGMLDQAVGAYTFSKSFSMSGWRLGFAVAGEETANRVQTLINTTLSCVPPFVQLAGVAALTNARDERDRQMRAFQAKVERLVVDLRQIDGVSCLMPGGTFYVFPSVASVCNRLGITSHGLALFLLERADERLGVACLGGECFGEAGGGFLRLSCAEPDERLGQAVRFMAEAFTRTDRVSHFLSERPQHRLTRRYHEAGIH